MFDGLSPVAKAWLLIVAMIIAFGGGAAAAAAAGGASIGWAIVAGLSAGFGQIVTALMKSPAQAREAVTQNDAPPFRPPVWLIGFAALSLGALVGCMTVNKATVTLTSVVDAGMKDWAQASVEGRTTPELDSKVMAAHEDYRRVCGAIVPIYEAAIARGENPDAAAVLATLRAAVDPLMDLILTVLPPAQQATLNTQLERVNAP